MRPLALNGGQLKGPGGDFLIESASEAEFLVIGESHGNAETPQLTAALLPSLVPHGYDVLALELGPITTELLSEDARRGGEPALRAVHQRHPFTTGFLNWREERDLFATAVEEDWQVWGVDQEFMGGDRLLLERLVELAPDDTARAAAGAALKRASEGFAQFAAKGDSSRGFLMSTPPAEFDRLEEAFDSAPAAAHRIIEGLRDSARVYGHYGAGRYFENNRDRVRLMKRYAVDALAASAEAGRADPRIVFKLGSAHAGRGFSPYDQLDVGNLAAELAVLRGGGSFHVYVMAGGAVGSDGDRRDYLKDAPHLAPLIEAMPEGEAAIFDMRPLRPLLSSTRYREAFPELHDLARRFDAVLLFQTFRDADPLVPLPGGGE